MMSPIQLTEYQNWHGELSEEDAEFIWVHLSQYPRKFVLQRELHGRSYILNPQQFVGLLSLPSGRLLESKPKVSVGALFYMLAVAFELPTLLREEMVHLERIDELYEIIASHFADLVQARIDQGLYRTYIERDDNLVTIRGRIDFSEDLRLNSVLRHRTYCRFEELTWDIPENQVIRQVVYLLKQWQFSHEFRLRLRRVDADLSEISLTAFPAEVIDQFHYHRLNEAYQQPHQLCRLFLESASLSERIGTVSHRAFLIDMNKLFESFVSSVLQERAPLGMRVSKQEPVYLGQDKQVIMRPDLVIRQMDLVKAVIDCKNKRFSAGGPANEDVFQVLAYCTVLKTERGMLIYPVFENAPEEMITVNNSPVRISRIGINLSGNQQEISQACNRFAHRVLLFEHN